MAGVAECKESTSHVVLIHKEIFGFKATPGTAEVGKALNEDWRIKFRNVSGHTACLRNVPGVAQGSPPDQDITLAHGECEVVDFSETRAGVYEYLVVFEDLGLRAEGNSDPRIIIYR